MLYWIVFSILAGSIFMPKPAEACDSSGSCCCIIVPAVVVVVATIISSVISNLVRHVGLADRTALCESDRDDDITNDGDNPDLVE
ncbi:unnamed protein product [Rotaria magnacalcarata]|uniref:Uncharacterized protein n=2 Tax=Rotaria magnacalcarata TaxID=392030 RepID=A0A815VM16_9BILA|nr:unnamed protein product [Rotaria magnacalcarata]